MSDDSGCKGCKRIHEHVASLLPFKVLEAEEGKPLRISGVAMAAGISRNFNIYTPEELQAFAEKLIGAPIYLEHVTANEAVGKTTNAFYDQKSRCIMYEAEVYDEATADKLKLSWLQALISLWRSKVLACFEGQNASLMRKVSPKV